MRHNATHSFTFLITLLCITFLSITSQAQNTSPVKVIEFRMIPNGTMDELRLEKNQRTDYDDNPVCEIQVKAQGFDEEVMQRFKFSANGPWITKVEFDDSKNEWRIYLSSKRRGSLKIKYQGDCVFDLPAALKPKAIYELTLGMETATLNIITTPEDAAIYIDGERAGTGYASRAVSIGAEHRYKVECEDYITEESMVKFTQSEKKEVNIELRPDFGYITVKSTPSGAEVYIDKKKAGTTPYLMEKIKRGQHVVEVRKEGYEPFANMLTIKAGEMNSQYENVVLEAVRVAKGTIVLESDPAGAVVTIDGRQYGQTPKTLTEFPVGTYTVYFTKEGYQNLAQNIDLKDGRRETLSVTMSKTSAPQQQVVQQQPVPQQPAPTGTAGAGGGSAAGGAQIASSINVLSFELVRNGIMDEGKLVDENGKPDKKKLYDVNNNPVCLVKVKAQGFDESILEKLIITPMGAVRITHKLFVNGEWKLYVSSKVPGSIKIRYKGECIYKLPYPLEAKKIYEMTLGMEPVVPQQPVATGAGGTAAADNKTFTVNGVSFEMVAVKGGTFTMGGTSEQGSDAYLDEKPTHSVTLGDYYIGKFEVTQELWEAVMGSNPSYFKGSKLPVEQVSWDDCQTFIRKLNSLTGKSFRLPTEAEWEFAARGGSKSKGYKYSGSNSIGEVAWYTDNSGSKTHPVGTKSPNELGIYDMSGNVHEWCYDWYGSYGSGSQTNPQGPSSGSGRVFRGGGWSYNAQRCRVSGRDIDAPDFRYCSLGFRLVVSQ